MKTINKECAVVVEVKFDIGYTDDGWRTADQQAKWEYFTHLIASGNVPDMKSLVFWHLVRSKERWSADVLLADTTGCIYFHPEGFKTILHKDEYSNNPDYFPALTELKAILDSLTKFVGGSYTIETKEVEI